MFNNLLDANPRFRGKLLRSLREKRPPAAKRLLDVIAPLFLIIKGRMLLKYPTLFAYHKWRFRSRTLRKRLTPVISKSDETKG